MFVDNRRADDRRSVSEAAIIFTIMIIVTLALSLVTACASTPREKILQNTILAGAVGALIGQSRSEYKNTYSMMYAGSSAAIAGAVSTYYYLSKEEDLKTENDALKARLDQFQKQMDPTLIQKGNSLFSSPLPREVSSLIEPGEWKRYKMDQWVQDPNQSNTWYRQVEMFEIIPPVSK